jgi:hypothetical protein
MSQDARAPSLEPLATPPVHLIAMATTDEVARLRVLRAIGDIEVDDGGR